MMSEMTRYAFDGPSPQVVLDILSSIAGLNTQGVSTKINAAGVRGVIRG